MTWDAHSLVGALRSEMQSQILKAEIPAGAALTEQSVADRFDVARPTAKAAIEQLVHAGLLTRVRNKTARVVVLGESDISDLYLARGVVECSIARILAERAQVPRAAVLALDRFRSAIESGGEVAELVAWDIAFHRALAAATESPRLCRLHEIVIGEAHLCMAQVQLRQLLDPLLIADEHARVIDSISAGDPIRAAMEMGTHLARARTKLMVLGADRHSVAVEHSTTAD